jgi:hypothetical protein
VTRRRIRVEAEGSGVAVWVTVDHADTATKTEIARVLAEARRSVIDQALLTETKETDRG